MESFQVVNRSLPEESESLETNKDFTKVNNLMSPILITEIESVLAAYPDHPYQKAFAISDLRQQLTTYVLSRILNFYAVAEEESEHLIDSHVYSLIGQKPYLKFSIQQGIQQILQKNSDWINRHIPSETDPGNVPSHWFG